MKSNKLPDEINYAEAYLTFRCNLSCSYCINAYGGISRRRKEMSGSEWIDALNKLDFGDIPITFGGGEPTLHRDFYEIINGVNPKVDLLTNLQFNEDEFIEKTTPELFTEGQEAYKSIRASYHVEQMDSDDLIEKAKKLQEAGYKIGIFGIRHPFNDEANIEMTELARQNQIYFFVKDFLGEHNGELYGHYKYPDGLNGIEKKVQCRSRELLISPEGNVHRCHRDLYLEDNPIGNIKDGVDLYKWRDCSHFGNCNPCDLKLKTDRFLQTGNCQVEIK